MCMPFLRTFNYHQAISALVLIRDFAKVKTSASLFVKGIRYHRADVVIFKWNEMLPDDVRCFWVDHGVFNMAVGEIWFAFQDGSETLLCVSVWRYSRNLASRIAPSLEVTIQDHPVLLPAYDLIQPCIHRRDEELCAVLLPRVPPFLRP